MVDLSAEPPSCARVDSRPRVQFHDILYTLFRDILYTPARA